jgi:hypothetical protein
MSFPNQRLAVYVEPCGYIRGNEFISARLVGPHPIWNFSVEVKMRQSAIDKINALAGRADFPKLGVFKRGVPVLLIQGIHSVPGDIISWKGFESEKSAHSMLDPLLG